MGTSRRRRPNRPRKMRLDRLIEEAIVDAYGESEQAVGLYTMIEEHLALPFETMVLGVPVTVVRVDLTQRDELVAEGREMLLDQRNLGLPAFLVDGRHLL